MPNTGDLRKDLRRIAKAVARQLSKPSVVALAGALVIASTEDPELSGFIKDFWQARFRAVGNVIRRALARGEAARGFDPDQALERLVAPLYFRAIITGRPIDNQLIELCVSTVIADFQIEQRYPLSRSCCCATDDRSQPPRGGARGPDSYAGQG
jgi:hypothetical protein